MLGVLAAVVVISAPAGQRVAVLPLVVNTSRPVEVSAVEDRLRSAAVARAGFKVLSREETASALSGAKGLGVSCAPDDAACLAKVGVLSGLSLVISPILVDRDGVLALQLVIADATSGSSLPTPPPWPLGDGTERDVLECALDDNGAWGALELIGLEPDATVSIDGRSRAERPLLSPLRIGKHTVVVSGERGNRSYAIEIAAGAALPLDVAPPTTELPPTPIVDEKPPPWLGIGITSAGAAVALGGVVTALILEGTLQTDAGDRDDRALMQLVGRGAIVGAVAGVIVAGAGGALIAASLE